jgi:hypothetical protein
MGKMALLLVLGLSITVGIIAATMNSSKRALGENVTGFDRYATGRNLAHTGVNMLLRKFDRKDSTLIYTIGTPKWGTYRSMWM